MPQENQENKKKPHAGADSSLDDHISAQFIIQLIGHPFFCRNVQHHNYPTHPTKQACLALFCVPLVSLPHNKGKTHCLVVF